MKNPFVISRIDLVRLYGESKRQFVNELFFKSLNTFSRDNIAMQLATQSGPIVEAINVETRKSAQKTENVEVLKALQLSDFYSPHEETEICFELRSDVDPKSIKSYDDLVSSFEDGTHIDCQVRTKTKNLNFQVKRYPADYLKHTNEAFMEWFEKLTKHYSEMSGTILAVLLQPSEPHGLSEINPSEILKMLISQKEKISFDEIVFTYNDRNKFFTLHRVYPVEKKLGIPLDWGLKRMRGEI